MTIPPAFLTALDLFDAQPTAARLRAYGYELLRLTSGGRVADVGCGTGLAVAELTALGATAIGVDLNPAMIEVARHRHPRGEYQVGSALDLPFADGSLAGYRADKVLHDLADPQAALAEARRVLSAGACIVLTDLDWDTIAIASDDPARTRAVVQARTDALPAGFAARQAPELLRSLGFLEVSTTAETAVITSPDVGEVLLSRIAGDDADWLAEQRTRAARGDLLVFVPIVVTAASRQPAV
ncbi:methyltransferase family protein [Asanoa ferruginea]|uniref:Methyltransferase family protein n=1 Tax=Asanoa ferruginea TaxID=53367 RepID=A0A3D9ZXD1_9ACTN|nr:methyltransferase domain-containing protein [Asanoa ferruginea]REG01235.1 methyltransferase family protein [Asanoa ferruginea]